MCNQQRKEKCDLSWRNALYRDLTADCFCLLKEKDLYEHYQMENINNGIFVLVFLTFGQTLV